MFMWANAQNTFACEQLGEARSDSTGGGHDATTAQGSNGGKQLTTNLPEKRLTTFFFFLRNQSVFGFREGAGTFCPGSWVNPVNFFSFEKTTTRKRTHTLPILSGSSFLFHKFCYGNSCFDVISALWHKFCWAKIWMRRHCVTKHGSSWSTPDMLCFF